MEKILGLDLGTNSIGWALVDNRQSKILGMGSRIFPEGVDNLGEGERELSKNAGRTQHRGTRRQCFRRRLRKWHLLRVLAKYRLCPLTVEAIKDNRREQLLAGPTLTEWFKLNPYTLRGRAIREKITLEELGRVFYHMIQRRGFQSNSRSNTEDKEGKIFKGKVQEGKIGITATQENIAANGKGTLGAYLDGLFPPESQPYANGQERIRNRYTTRQMYIDEFEAIWTFQEKHHSELTPSLKAIIGGRKKEGFDRDGVLFHQRPLRSQKHLIGYCTFEPGKARCPLSAIPFELYRIYQWVNTVEYNDKRLNEEERQQFIDKLSSKEKIAFKMLRKAINKTDSAYNFNYKDDDKIVGTRTISTLSNKKFFGKRWFDFTEKEQTDIWHTLFFFEDHDRMEKYAKTKWGFDDEQAAAISRFKLKDGYANLSRKAITNILPFLKQGFLYNVATVLGGIKNAFGRRWDSLTEEERNLIIDNIEGIIDSGQKGGFIEGLKSFLKDEFDLSDKALKKLYHHSADINVQTTADRLPVDAAADREIQQIRNPVVITAIFEVRKLVNEIIDTHGKPDKIRIELARDLKISKSRRNDVRREQKRLEAENDRVKKELEHHGQVITYDNVMKYKLWEECKETCPYTGRSIGVTDLFSGAVQVEHIVPYSKSLNDSFMNKTLCFADENRAKGDRTPYEFYSRQSPERWEEVKQQALNCFKNKEHYPNAYAKFKQFVRKKYDDDFVSRQLNDTRYISKAAKNYLTKIVDHQYIDSVAGQATAPLRHKWGLNKLLDETNEKNRGDHRHHAIDALVVACMKKSHMQALSRWSRDYSKDESRLKDFPRPWEGFWEDVRSRVNRILVSYRKTTRLLTSRRVSVKKEGKRHINRGIAARGQLHKESVYGRRKPPHAEEVAYHIRKPVETLKTIKQVGKVVDPAIRSLIRKRIEALGGLKAGKLPEGLFFRKDDDGTLHPQLFLPNKNGEPVPIKKVRMSENVGRAEPLKTTGNQYVNPRNNHHALIYKDVQGELKEDTVTFWTAVERKRQGQPVYQLPPDGEEVVATLQINDMFLLDLPAQEIDWERPDYTRLNRHLYRVQKVSSLYYVFRHHRESQLDGEMGRAYWRISSLGRGKGGWQRFNPIKVAITPMGKPVKI